MHHPNRILITRLSAIGDAILTAPLLCAVRDHFPSAFIAWLAEAPAAPVLDGHPALDQLVVVPRRWMKSPREVWRLRSRLRQLRVDTTIDPQGLTKSSLPAWLSGARLRIGLAGPKGCELSPLLNNRFVLPHACHVVDRSLELLKPLGIDGAKVRFDLPLDAKAAQWAENTVIREGLKDGFAIINPGAGWDSRLWPTERFGSIAKYMRDKFDMSCLVTWAGGRERQWAQEIVSTSNCSARLAPETSLQQLGALLRLAQLFVGCDTGPLHYAAAVGTKCVSLHGTTRVEESGPYGDSHEAIQVRFHEGTRRERRNTHNAAMKLIQVDQVCDACEKLLYRVKRERNTAA